MLPVAHDAGRLWRRNALVKRPGSITVSIGEPIAPQDLTPQELNTRVEEWIEAEMQRLAQRPVTGDRSRRARYTDRWSANHCSSMRAALYSIALAILIAGCGYKGPLYLPKPKPVAQKPAAAGDRAGARRITGTRDAGRAAGTQPQDDATRQ